MIAGYTTLLELKNNPSIYTELDQKTVYLRDGLKKTLDAWGQSFVINQFGSMISLHFSDHPVIDFSSASAANNKRFNQFFHAMLEQGIYLPPSAFESWFLNNALTKEDLDETIRAAEKALSGITA